VEKLKAAGVLYPCYETPEELDLRRKIRRTRGLPPVYGREALALTQDEITEFEADGRRPHWRFLLPNFASDPAETQRTEVHWNDLVRGEETVDLASLSDPVLVREDGTYLYTLPSVVDDIDMGVTHVIRGDDHVTNTGVQIALFRALGAEPPVFGHHNLLTTSSGEGLSKRSGALSVESLREAGVEPMAIASLAVLIGTSENVQAIDSLAELATHFDPASTSKSAAKFDPDELFVLNRALLHRMPFEEVRDRLVLFGIADERAEAFWNAVRGNLDKIADARDWWRIVNEGPLEAQQFDAETLEFLRSGFALLPEEPWGDTVWKQWTGAIRKETGRKGKELFAPLRLALTGRSSGPELAELLPIIGREGTLARRP
jgi:glutamyl-tRNA synthetase